MNIWKEYSLSYIRNNRISSISIVFVAFIASVLLSLTCGVFFNIWTDDIRLIELETGDWHGKLTGNITEDDVEFLERHASVKNVIFNETDIGNGRTAYLYFDPMSSIYKDLPELAEKIGLTVDNGKIEYNNKLLEQYFIFSPEEKMNPPLIPFIYLLTMLGACFSLIMTIHNAFGVSMNARLHQLGLLQSIGATPRQIRSVLVSEALILCLLPIIAGVALGAGLCYVFIQIIQSVTDPFRDLAIQFQYNPFIFIAALSASFITVWLSARIPAVKMSRISPLEAIQYGKTQPVNKVKRIYIFSRLFGIESDLAEKSIYARRKAFKTSTIALTLSFLIFSAYLNFNTISSISTHYTFFERYKDKWDLMVNMNVDKKDGDTLLSGIRNIPGVSKCISYRNVNAYSNISKDMLSDDLLFLGGIEVLKDTGIQALDNYYKIKTPFIILDDESFREYCNEIGAAVSLSDGTELPAVITINTIWDNINSGRNNKKLIPFIKVSGLQDFEFLTETAGSFNAMQIALTDKFPEIREEFENFTLPQVTSASSFEKTAQYFSAEKIFYNIKAASEDEIASIQDNIKILLNGKYEYTTENRQETEESNISTRNVKILLIGILSSLLFCIGLANVFSNTLGHIHQRRREFARYVTNGLTPKGVWNILLVETAIISLKPIVISLLINIPIVLFALNKSQIPLNEFIKQMPIVPVMVFALLIILSVVLANYLGGRKIYRLNLVDALKDDTMF